MRLAAVWCAACCVCLPMSAAGGVRISEFVAATSERVLERVAGEPPRLGTGLPWQEDGFDDADWPELRGPFGVGYPDVATRAAASHGDDSAGLYLRKRIVVEAGQAGGDGLLVLRVDYDAGFVLWINGREVIRKNLGPAGMFVYRDQPAFNAHPAGVEEEYELGPAAGWLRAGENLVAVQVQPSVKSAKLKFALTLVIRDEEETPLVQREDPYRLFQSPVEPSGGVYDLSVAEPSFSDWIELHNDGEEEVDLSGWRLRDHPDRTDAFEFPAGTRLEPGGSLVVLASDGDLGDGSVLHAAFGLSADGEHVILEDSGGGVVDEVVYPAQDFFHSYGRSGSAGDWVYFREATPGGVNPGKGLIGRVEAPELGLDGGFHEGPVAVTLSTPAPGSTIRFSVDGSEPTDAMGEVYEEPILIQPGESLAVRARAFREGWISSPVVTATYLIGQPEAIRSLPAVCLTGDREKTLFMPEGVTAIFGGVRTNPDGVPIAWRAVSPDDYNMPIMHGGPFEKPASLEIRYADGRQGMANSVGVRFAGSDWARPRLTLVDIDKQGPWSGLPRNKPSFAVFLRPQYGARRWGQDFFNVGEVFHDEIRLRAGSNDHFNPFIRDELTRRLFARMGHVSSRGILSTLFVNGDFKGYYNPVETLNETFFQNAYDSGEQWDILKLTGADEGDLERWTAFYSSVRSAALTDLEEYQRAAADLDVTNFVDYLILNAYAVVRDWPTNNFVLARERSASGRWRYCVWDAESSFGEIETSGVDFNLFPGIIRREDLLNRLSPQYGIPNLYTLLSANSEFRLTFADRLQKHLFDGGSLTPERVVREASVLMEQLTPIMRYVRNQKVRDPFTAWAEARTPYLLEHCAAEGLWPALAAPGFSLEPGELPGEAELSLSTGGSGASVFYTLDGSDPRALGGAPAGLLYEGPLTIAGAVTVLARAFDGVEWSPLREGSYRIGTGGAPVAMPGDTWRFRAGGVSSGDLWASPDYQDGDWNEGRGVFSVEPLPSTGAEWQVGTQLEAASGTTHYFRREFEYPGDVNTPRQLNLRCLLAGGAVVYLNGEEIFRHRMPAGEVAPETPATGDGGPLRIEGPFSVAATSLLLGRNVLAVEVHGFAEGAEPAVFGLEAFVARPRVVISEMHYHPRDSEEAGDGEEREFLEVENRGAVAADLSGWSFSDGVEFLFPDGSVLEPGAVFVLVRDPAAFETAYPGVVWHGAYRGALNNAGERVALSDRYGNEVFVVEYSDEGEWPSDSTDGGGWSLRYLGGAGPDATGAASWTPGSVEGGSPGWVEIPNLAHTGAHWLRMHGLIAWEEDVDGDGIGPLIEYACGLGPRSAAGQELWGIEVLGSPEGRRVRLATPWNPVAEDVEWAVQRSLDLETWEDVQVLETELDSVAGAPGGYVRRFTMEGQPGQAFYRFRVALQEQGID